MIYLERSTASALNIREMRQTLEDCCASKFSFFKIPSLPLPPVSYIKPTEVINKLIDLTNTVDHELYALEVMHVCNTQCNACNFRHFSMRFLDFHGS